MSKRNNYKESFIVRWVLLLLSLLVPSLALHGQKDKVFEDSFPYEFWKPKSQLDTIKPTSDVAQTSSSKQYGFFYGEPISSKENNDPSTWNIPPIKIPKDIIAEVKEKTTINPLKDITTHPSSLIPQYGRHPGGTEQPPLYFPHRFSSKRPLEEGGRTNPSHHRSSSKFKPVKMHFWKYKKHTQQQQASSPASHHHIPYSQKQVMKTPPNRIEVLTIDRNHNPPPHAFYAIQDSSDLKIGILHKNKTHSTYLSPEEYEKQLFNNLKNRTHTRKTFRPPRQKYDILDYSRYEVQKELNHPQSTRKTYNENLIELIKKKLESKSTSHNRMTIPLHVSNQNLFSSENEVRNTSFWPKPQTGNPIIGKDYVYKPNTQTYNTVKSTKYRKYETTPYPFRGRPSKINPKYMKPRPNSVYPTTKYYYSPIRYNTANRLTTRIKNFFNDALSLTPKPAPNAYPQKKHSFQRQPSKHYLYYYHSKEEEDSYEPKKKSIMERIASIQQSPATLVIPGGLAVLGLGLAFYYFNYVWYPTPVVTARLLQLLRSFTGQENFDLSDEKNEIGKILEAFRGLEMDQFSKKFTSESCRSRLVCQLHQDIPNLWEVTQVISNLLRSHLESSEYEKALMTYLETAKRGTQHEKSCKNLFHSCALPYVPLNSLLNLLSEPEQQISSSDHGESRVL